jgi:long-subunit fatty acid transport protein
MGTLPRRIRILVSPVCLGLLLAAPEAGAQSTAEIADPVELQETDIFGMGARSMGMGGAYTGVAEDITAIAYNPAGLSQIRRIEISTGFAHDDLEWKTTHAGVGVQDRTATRLDHAAVAYPVPTYRGSLVVGFGFHRWADLDVDTWRQGYLIEPTSTVRGLYEEELFQREGTVNAFTGAVAYDLSPNISVGASITYLHGNLSETLSRSNYRATLVGNQVELDLGTPGDPDSRLFQETVSTESDINGFTGSLGVLGYMDSGFRFGAAIDLPVRLDYDGNQAYSLEDYEKVDEYPLVYFENRITLPLTLKGGVSWGRKGFLLAGGLRWTDYTQIDYAGRILAPPDQTGRRESAYRSVVAVNLGAEYQLAAAPVRFRAGFFTEPLPYKLIAADPDFVFVPDDNDPNTYDDFSIAYRDYPVADITSDQKFFTLGAGIVLDRSLTVDAAFVHGWWERSTPAGYENTTDYFPTVPTTEKVTQNRFFVSTTFHLE